VLFFYKKMSKGLTLAMSTLEDPFGSLTSDQVLGNLMLFINFIWSSIVFGDMKKLVFISFF